MHTKAKRVSHTLTLLRSWFLRILIRFYFSDSFLSILFSMVREIGRKNNDFQKWVNNTLKALNMSSVVKALDEGK